jgi:hypothetical protein
MEMTNEEIKKIYDGCNYEVISGKAALLRRGWVQLRDKVNFRVSPQNNLAYLFSELKRLLEQSHKQLQSGELRYTDKTLGFTVELSEDAINMLKGEVKKIDEIFPDIINFTEENYTIGMKSINEIARIITIFTEQFDKRKTDIIIGVLESVTESEQAKNVKVVININGEFTLEAKM